MQFHTLANEAARQGFIGREMAERNPFCQRASTQTVENDMDIYSSPHKPKLG